MNQGHFIIIAKPILLKILLYNKKNSNKELCINIASVHSRKSKAKCFAIW